MQHPKQNDWDLWLEIRRGSPDAMGELYARYARTVGTYVLRRTADPEMAEEVISQVFLEVWAKRRSLEPREMNLKPLLLGIATNMMRSSWRQAARRRRLASQVRGLERAFALDDTDLTLERVDAKARIEKCRDEIASLPRKLGDVVALVSLGDLTYEETAGVLGVPVGTVRSRMSRARSKLQPAFEPKTDGKKLIVTRSGENS